LRADGFGRYVAAPYQAPASRPVVRQFLPGAQAIHVPEFTREQDLAAIPNRVVRVSAASGEDEALVGVAENTDPASPFSFPARGRWLVHTEEGTEATSQQVIDDLAARRLVELSSASASVQIAHAAVPLDVNDVVHLVGDGVDARAAVQSWRLNL